MAWYNKAKRKPKKKESQHTVTCVHCNKEHIALDGGWTVNGRGDVLCFGTERSCFYVLFELSKKANRQEQASKGAEREMEPDTGPPEGW